jgi:hypothetical protein
VGSATFVSTGGTGTKGKGSVRELANQEFGRLLVATNLAKGDSSRLVAMGLLDTTSLRGRLASGFRGELLAGGLSSGRFTSGLLSTTTRPRRQVSALFPRASSGGAGDCLGEESEGEDEARRRREVEVE